MRDLIDIVKYAVLNEGRVSKLYHGTSIYAAASIIEENIIRAGDHDDGPHGVSLTTKEGVAKGFAKDVDHREIDNAAVDGIHYADYAGSPWSSKGCVLVFNQSSVKTAITLVRHCWDGCDSEHELRAKGDGFRIADHLLAILVNDADLDWWITAYRGEAVDWKNAGDDREAGFALGRASMVSNLKAHPLRRR